MQGVTNPAKHLIKGMYPWLAENDPTVYFSFNINHPGVHMTANSFRREPAVIITEKGEQVQITIVTLNLEPTACGRVKFDEETIFMQCRSQGQLVECTIPFESILRMWCPHDKTGFLAVVPPYRYPEVLAAEPPKLEAVPTNDGGSEQTQTAPTESVRPMLKRVK